MAVDFDSLDKITNLVSKPTPTLSVKHVINLTRKNMMKDKEKLGYAFTFKTEGNQFYPGTQGIYFNCSSVIQLDGLTNKVDKDGKTIQSKISCIIDPKNFTAFLIAIDNAYSWLLGEKYTKTFVLDDTGRPLKICDPFQKETCPLSQTNYIAFKPAIIRDAFNVRYEGISMITPKGEITNFVAIEFASFKDQMHSLLPNLYTATGMLVNQALMYSVYSKLKEKEVK